MTIAIEALSSCDAFQECERLQEEARKVAEGALLRVPLLVFLERSGGGLLGAYEVSEEGSRRLSGCLIDLVAHYAGTPARLTVLELAFGEGGDQIARLLRLHERQAALVQGVRLIAWPVDPLRGAEAHRAFSGLAAIGVSYERDLFGAQANAACPDLATDRLGVEWWIDSPRVAAVVDRGLPPHHTRVGLERMAVVTRTALAEGSVRRLVDFDPAPKEEAVLVEIPENLDPMLLVAPDLARDWRLRTREVFETLFDRGYIASGFVREAGRSFHLLECAEREVFLRRPA